MDAVEIKLLSIAVLFVLGLAGGIPPLCCIKVGDDSSSFGLNDTARRVIGLLNSAAAGVFLSIALVHLLPDSRLLFERSLNITHDHGGAGEDGGGMGMAFDWAGFTAACGFLMIVLTEQVMMWCMEHAPDSHDEPEQITSYEDSNLVRTTEATFNDEASDSGVKDFNYGALHERSPTPTSGRESLASLEHSIASMKVGVDIVLVDQPLSTFRAIILLVSLSLHSVFEGLALGLQLGPSDTIDLLIAIAIHKAIESFTVLLRFAQLPGRTALKWISLFVFSLASPVGIAIGIPLADPSLDPDALLVNAILQGLATGTFIFVTFIELLPVELAGKKDRFLKFFCLLAGFGLLCGLSVV